MYLKSLFLLALALGPLAGYVDLHAKEVQFPVLLILLFTCLLSLAHPKGAWRWALIVGGGIPLAHFIGRAMGYAPPYPILPNIFATFLALIPAFIGAYGGMLLRHVTTYAHKQGS